MNTDRRLAAAALAACMLLAACGNAASVVSPSTTSTPTTTTTSSAPSTTPEPPETTTVPGEFDGHTTDRLDSIADYEAYARRGAGGQSVVKFSIPDFFNSERVHWMDSNFYELHDEWYWFHLLNGQPIPGSTTTPVDGLGFTSIDEVYSWAGELTPSALPLDLRFVDSTSFGRRLYSPEFYELALDREPRVLGVGALVRLTSETASDRWLIELEYSDEVTPAEVELFFERLIPTLPEAIGAQLEWVTRSPFQESVAERMRDEGLPFADRVVRYGDLVPQGQVTVYNEGVTAGRLLLVGDGETALTDARDDDIVIMAGVPDWLPPANALITSDPQTPLAHVNLLARNRGIPNASQVGILDDAQILQAARVRAPAIVRASADGLEVQLITNAEYRRWRSLHDTGRVAVPPVDASSLPLALDLEDLATTIGSEADVERWRPVIGGKSAGFLALLSTEGVITPERPLAVTVAPYRQHLASVQEALTAILSSTDFANDARVRYLVLEGPSDFAEQYPDPADAAVAEALARRNPEGTPIGEVLAADGFKKYFRNVPMNPETLDELERALDAQFGDYAATQGLRFRSSSSVEDIEGFSGAGLYDSNTGFLDPSVQPDADDRKKTIERTIKKTWASYWGFEAFEERRREGVDHQSGGMGVLVHARFDDPLEVNNGVATFTLLPEGTDLASSTINVQLGAESVTNPDPASGALPEVWRVTIGRNGSVATARETGSTLSPDEPVLSVSEVEQLVDQLRAVALLWRDRVNADLPDAQAIETLTLDFEFKTMAAGWPATSETTEQPAQLVVKQARSLDPGLRGLSAEVLDLPVPRDVLARARSVLEISCGEESRVEVLTDPLAQPDMGFAVEPFVVGPGPATGEDCVRTILHSTPSQYLVELLDGANA